MTGSEKKPLKKVRKTEQKQPKTAETAVGESIGMIIAGAKEAQLTAAEMKNLLDNLAVCYTEDHFDLRALSLHTTLRERVGKIFQRANPSYKTLGHGIASLNMILNNSTSGVSFTVSHAEIMQQFLRPRGIDPTQPYHSEAITYYEELIKGLRSINAVTEVDPSQLAPLIDAFLHKPPQPGSQQYRGTQRKRQPLP